MGANGYGAWVSEWITAREAAAILGVHKSNIPKMLRRGELTKRRQRPILNRAEVIACRDAREAACRALAEAREKAREPRRPRPPDSKHDWLLADAAAAVMGISRVAVNARARREQLPSAKSDGRRWYRRDHLELLLRSQTASRDRNL
jgi:hypothetical protein